MELEKRIRNFKKAQNKNKKKTRQKEEQVLQKSIEFYSDLNEFILEIANPTFENYNERLRNQRVQSGVEIIRKRVESISPSSNINYGIEIRLSHLEKAKGPLRNNPTASRLTLTGNLQTNGLIVDINIPHRNIVKLNKEHSFFSEDELKTFVEQFMFEVFPESG